MEMWIECGQKTSKSKSGINYIKSMDKSSKYLKPWGFHERDYSKPLKELGLSSAVQQYLLKYIDRFDAMTEEGLLLMGNPRLSTQVSSRMVYDLLQLGKIHHQAKILDIPTYIIRYQLFEQGERAAQESRLFELMEICDIVVFQEMGLNQLTPTQQSRLYTLIQSRYAAHKPFIVTTVCDLKTLELNLGQSIYYRIVSPNQVLEVVNAR